MNSLVRMKVVRAIMGTVDKRQTKDFRAHGTTLRYLGIVIRVGKILRHQSIVHNTDDDLERVREE